MTTNPETNTRSLEAEILGGLAEAYADACTTRNYRLCDRIRATIQMNLAGKTSFIKIESGLDLNPTIW